MNYKELFESFTSGVIDKTSSSSQEEKRKDIINNNISFELTKSFNKRIAECVYTKCITTDSINVAPFEKVCRWDEIVEKRITRQMRNTFYSNFHFGKFVVVISVDSDPSNIFIFDNNEQKYNLNNILESHIFRHYLENHFQLGTLDYPEIDIDQIVYYKSLYEKIPIFYQISYRSNLTTDIYIFPEDFRPSTIIKSENILDELYQYSYNKIVKTLNESFKTNTNIVTESIDSGDFEYGIDVLFKKKYDNVMIERCLRETFRDMKAPVSINNTTEIQKLYKTFTDKVYNREKVDLRMNIKAIPKILDLAGIRTVKGFQNQIKENSVFLASQGYNMSKILLDVKRGRKSKLVVDDTVRAKYSTGEEIDLNYNGDGFEDFDNQIVLRSQHGETPMVLYGFNGAYSAQVCNELRKIYSIDYNADYYYCSGISLRKWKECSDVRKRCCDRNGELYDL